MNDNIFISQTMLKEYEEMCPLAFKSRWFGSDKEKPLFDRYVDVMKRGVLFETLAIGSGMGGKMAIDGDVPVKSVFFSRIKEHAKRYREWEETFASSVIGSQLLIQRKIEWEEGVYYAQGNLDRVVRDKDGVLTVIDLKLSGDTKSGYGKFQWNNRSKIDWTQLKHYGMLLSEWSGEPVRSMFYVADTKIEMNRMILEMNPSENVAYDHNYRCQTAYDNIVSSLISNTWIPNPSEEKCKECPLGDIFKLHGTGVEICKYKQTVPDIELINVF